MNLTYRRDAPQRPHDEGDEEPRIARTPSLQLG